MLGFRKNLSATLPSYAEFRILFSFESIQLADVQFHRYDDEWKEYIELEDDEKIENTEKLKSYFNYKIGHLSTNQQGHCDNNKTCFLVAPSYPLISTMQFFLNILILKSIYCFAHTAAYSGSHRKWQHWTNDYGSDYLAERTNNMHMLYLGLF